MRVNSEPLLLATPSGDALELRPAGPWVAANVSTLETLLVGRRGCHPLESCEAE